MHAEPIGLRLALLADIVAAVPHKCPCQPLAHHDAPSRAVRKLRHLPWQGHSEPVADVASWAAGISYCRSAARGGAATRATATEPTGLPSAFLTSAKLISM